ncbi:MAG: hypothetical protein V3U07_06010, partial [Nitrospirales bacterium]
MVELAVELSHPSNLACPQRGFYSASRQKLVKLPPHFTRVAGSHHQNHEHVFPKVIICPPAGLL